MCASVFAQQVVLTFTGRDADNHFLPLSRVVIGNQTRGWQETICYPDTTLSFGATGIEENASDGSFGLAQNNPNPFNGATDVNLTVTEPGAVTMEITDVNGKIVETHGRASLQPGTHQFRINVANAGVYFLTARQNGKTSSVKMVNNGNGAGNGIEYVGTVETHGRVSLPTKTGEKGHTDNPFSVGDEMVYIGYAIVNGTEYTSQTIHQNQLVSETFVLNFNVTYEEPTGLATVTTGAVSDITGYTATCTGTVVDDGGYSVIARGICWSASHNPVFNDSHVSGGDGLGSFSCQLTGLTPSTTYYARAYAVNTSGTAYGNEVEFTTATYGQPCPGTPTLTDVDGNTYNTVQIGNQCWMKENLRTTKYADNTVIALGNGASYDVAYRYVPNNDNGNVATYGYLYNWKAVMRNSSSSSSTPSNVQGICPTGWHVPSDAEWTQLTDYVSSQSAYCCSGNTSNIAKALASTTGWNSSSTTCAVGNTPSSNNATGFSALPAGYYSGSYNYFGFDAAFWSATEYSSDGAYFRYLGYNNAGVVRHSNDKTYGYSVRCVRD